MGWYGVDLDGTLAHYGDWSGPEQIGAPIPLMVERVKRWLAHGKEVRIFTARVSDPDIESRSRIIAAIEAWCLKHVGQVLPVTNVKDYGMLEFWDDRAVPVIHNTGIVGMASINRATVESSALAKVATIPHSTSPSTQSDHA